MKKLFFIFAVALSPVVNAQINVVVDNTNYNSNTLSLNYNFDNLSFANLMLTDYFKTNHTDGIQKLINSRYGTPGSRFSIEFVSAYVTDRMHVIVLITDNNFYKPENFLDPSSRTHSRTGVFETELTNVEASFLDGTLSTDIVTIFNLIQ